MSDRNDLFLHDILESANNVLEFTQTGEDDFLASPLLQSAVVRQFEVMGEATKRLSDALRQRHPEVPWREMAAFRDRLIHGYMSVDPVIVWGAVERLPEVISQVEQVRSSVAG